MRYIVHIAAEAAWEAARRAGEYRAESLKTEGFIHASEPEQVAEVAGRLFLGREDLVLLFIDESRLDVPVVRENTTGGTIPYPHIYGPLRLDAVTAAFPYRPAGGASVPPSGIGDLA